VGAGVGAGGVRDVVSVGRVLAAACAAVSACLLAACAHAPAPAVPSAVAPSAVAPSAIAPTSTPAVGASRPDHVVIVMLENKNEGDVLREGPYLASLAASGAVLTDMHAETHPSQPNYLALFSGGTQGVDDDSCPHTFAAGNLASELTAAGYTFAGYSEDLPATGFVGCAAGDYARKHSPWTNFSAVPATANQPLSAMPTDYAALPTVSFLIPNLCHDMHDCSIAEGDAWLRQNIDGYAQWARTHNSMLLVSFDESESKDDDANHIATIAVGQQVVAGPVRERADHYRLLRTLEDLYGLPPLGRSAATTAIPALWRPAA
jgi:phosphatidylinositol-3-phosphatase